MGRFNVLLCAASVAAGWAMPALAPPALAQPWASEPTRQAGRLAIAAAGQQRWAEAETLAATADPLAAKVATWIRLQNRTSGASASELVGFVEANPDWPFQDGLARRAEEAVAVDPDDALALRLFARRAPRTLDGAQRLADALTRAGRSAEVAPLLRTAWVEAAADALVEEPFLSRNAPLISAEDHARRFDRLMFAREVGAASRQAQRLSGAARASAEARLAYAADRPDAEAAAPRGGDLGLAYERARWLRRRERDAEAAQVWRTEGEAAQRAMTAEVARAVWAERQVLARKLLRLGDAPAAYRTAAGHGIAEPGEPRQEAEFLAGFIALRRLENPAAAERHFALVGQGSQSVLTRARSAYWQGRALSARGDRDAARERFAAAAALPVAFYGQLGAVALGEDGARLAARVQSVPVPSATPRQAELFAGRELTRVVLLLADLGELRRALPFLLRLRELAAEPADQLLAARLAMVVGRPDHAVWVARRAWAEGVVLLAEGWPTPYQPPVTTPEPAIIFAITRQESNFDREAVSSANARGLMQLLPATAAQVARQLGIPHSLPMLTGDPAHNMRLGAAYLEQQLARYDGSLALAAAAYNAGPGRVNEWIVTYGDPRSGAIDKLDWIELIPFTETRNYVQRVIENTVVYRARDPAAAAQEHPLARWLRGPA
jgi:soluble lytic murein transglycosylase